MMPESRRRRRRWIMWLVLAGVPLGLAALLVFLITSPNGYVVLVDTTPGEKYGRVWTAGEGLEPEDDDLVWKGKIPFGSPIEIPFKSGASGYLRVEVRYEGWDEPVIGEEYLMRYYAWRYFFVVGEDDVLQFYEKHEGFQSPEE